MRAARNSRHGISGHGDVMGCNIFDHWTTITTIAIATLTPARINPLTRHMISDFRNETVRAGNGNTIGKTGHFVAQRNRLTGIDDAEVDRATGTSN